MRGGGAEGGGAVPELLVKYPATPGVGPMRYPATGVEEMKVVFLVFVCGPDRRGVEELLNLIGGGKRGRGEGEGE